MHWNSTTRNLLEKTNVSQKISRHSQASTEIKINQEDSCYKIIEHKEIQITAGFV
jgi:hypothetical protein